MSRIGKLPVAIPAGVTVEIKDNVVKVKGPKGTLERTFAKEITIKEEDGHLVVTRPNDNKKEKSLHGLSRALLFNMVEGVSNGYEKKLEINGVGYRAAKQGKTLTLTLGYSHPVTMEDPEALREHRSLIRVRELSTLPRSFVVKSVRLVRNNRRKVEWLARKIKPSFVKKSTQESETVCPELLKDLVLQFFVPTSTCMHSLLMMLQETLYVQLQP